MIKNQQESMQTFISLYRSVRVTYKWRL